MKELEGKVIIITGSSGLVGFNLIKCIPVFMNPPLIITIDSRQDITNKECIDALPEADYIIHAAGDGQPGKFIKDKLKTIAINTTATIELLKKLKPGGKFLFISTSEVYNGLDNPPFREDQIGTTKTTDPRACYIESKRCGEAICLAARESGQDVKIARLSLAYGPGTKKGDARVLNQFIEQGLTGFINLKDHGEARRTYLYIDDAISMMWDILLKGKDAIYNVGGNSYTTILELARKIGKMTNAEIIIPLREDTLAGSPNNVCLDMSKVLEEFGQRDFISLEKGLKRTIEWQKENFL